MTKPSIPQGTRDFLPVETARRNYIFATIKDIFKLYGFQPIETPAMENLSTLMGKYGEEGDKLLFKILNSGDYISKVSESELSERNSNKLISKISEKGLRYDLTVPFARFVVQHFNDITLPFKRFQIQPVWRADKPQRGRYREFYQCDVDVVGSNSLLFDAEYVEMVDRVFNKLGVSVTVKLNNRKILTGISEYIGYPEKITDITVAIDKLDKIGLDAVNNELRSKEISDEAIEKLRPIIELQGSTIEKLERLSQLLATSESGMQGVEEIRTVFEIIDSMELKNKVELDLSLARGLNYYTGTIYEVKANDVKIGSICGGGRYDNLTGIFGMAGISGVGISFGADRIYDVLTELNLFPAETMESTKVLFINFGKTEERHGLKLVKKLRDLGISSEIYPEATKMKKQFGFADSKKIEYVAVIGETEIANNQITLKNMQSGQQETLSESDFMRKFIGQ